MPTFINFSGDLIKSFLAGDGIGDIIIQSNKIVIAYFDEGVYGSAGPNKDGLAVFDFQGRQLFGVNSSTESQIIDDCYCICKHLEKNVLFYAYSILKVFELNLDTFSMLSFETPNDFRGASAISSKGGKLYFHSSYRDERSFFSWDIKTNEVIKFEDYSPGLTGIKDERFLVYGDKGYTIVDPTK